MAAVSVQLPVEARDLFRDGVVDAPAEGPRTKDDGVSDEDILRDIASVCDVPVDAIEDLYPCTPLQVGIIAQPIERIYVNCIYATLAPSLDLERFCNAIRHVYALNAVLRTRIVDSELGLVQVVIKEELAIARGPFDTKHNDNELETMLQREKSAPMRLGQPLFRAAVVGRTVVLTTHHAIADGGTYHSLFDNLSRAYRGQELAAHAEFRLFVKHCYAIENATAHSFWSPRFSGHPVAFPIMDVAVMPDARAKIKTTVSLDTLLHDVPVGLMSSYVETAWAVTAMSYTNAESIIFGRVLSARAPSLEGLESTLGPTIVTMPVQVNLSQNATIGSLIRERAHERREALNSPALQYGLVGLRTVSDAGKRAARFTTLINFRTPTDQGTDYISTELDIHGEYEPHLPYGLGISLVWNGQGLTIDTLYDPDIVCERQTRRLLRQFEHILALLLQSPAGTRLGALTLLNVHDRREMIGWNRLSTDPATNHTLHHLFRMQARAQPDAVAVRGPQDHLTYATLDRKSDAVAFALRSKGIGKEDSVVLIFNKSISAIVAQLGVLKAGAVCVPIDPGFPAARKQTIITGSGASMIMAGVQYHEVPSEWKGSVWVFSDDQDNLIDVSNDDHYDDGNDSLSSSQAAFLLFTSGSTGTPKGHILEHRNLVSSLTAIGRAMDLGQHTRMLQFAAYVWDMSIAEIHGTLLAGGCVCVPSDEERESAVAEYVTSEQVNTAIFTPTVLRLLTPHEAEPLKTIMSIGEPVDLESADTWSAAGCRFFNAWGPSETACVSAMAELTPASSYRGNIGRPLGSAIWLVDPRDSDASRLVPVGAVGEIVVEGQGVSRGYLNAVQQTAAAFIDPPTWAPSRRGPVRKLYRTGDLARYNPDGSLQYVGRQDTQVKVNGQRVELGEVEKALGSCKNVRQVMCVAQALEGHGFRKSLVAVVVLDPPCLQAPRPLKELSTEHEVLVSQTLETLRETLSSRLPSYMIPSVWKVVEDFPRTTSLKIDRSAIKKWLLAELASGDGSGADALVADRLTDPVSSEEVCLRSAWAEALGLLEVEVGRESSFIKLGGDSILAIKVATLCRKQGLRVSVANLLRSRSLAEVAENCPPLQAVSKVGDHNNLAESGNTKGDAVTSTDKVSLPAAIPSSMRPLLEDIGLDVAGVEAVIPCSPLQQDVTLSQAKDNEYAYWMRITLKLTPVSDTEPLDETRLLQSWKAVCSAHPILRTIIVSHDDSGSAFQQVILKYAPVSVSSSHLEEITDVGAGLAAVRPPDLAARRPQHHLHISTTTANIIFATIFINHALFDERSVRLLAEQLSLAYRDTASLTPGPSLAAYLKRVEGAKDATQLYWNTYLAGAEPCNIPKLTRAEAQLTQPGSPIICDVPLADNQRISSFCATQGITLATLMQLAWAVVLRTCTGSRAPVFGYLHSHAGWVEDGDRTMGPLLTMAYWRLRAGPTTVVQQLLKAAHEESLQALECGACSVSQLYEDLGVSSTPLFNTIMTIYRLPARADATVPVDGLRVEQMPLAGHNEYILTLGVAYNSESIQCKILFDPDRAALSFVSKVANLLSVVVESIVSDSRQTLESLETTLAIKEDDLVLFCPRDVSHDVRRKAAARCEVGSARIESMYPCTSLQREQIETAVMFGGEHHRSDLDQYIFDFQNGSTVPPAAEVRAAWESVISAYPILRSRIICQDAAETCAVVTLRSSTGIMTDCESSLAEYLKLDSEKPMRYGGPLCRVAVVEQADGSISSVLSIHRTICDPWTISLIERGLARASAGKAVLTDFQSNKSFSGLRACREAATATTKVIPGLPAQVRLNAPLFPSLQATGRRDGTIGLSGSLSFEVEGIFEKDTLHAAWALTLCRVTGSNQISFGAHVDGRSSHISAKRQEVAGPVGALHLFSVDMTSTPTVAALLASVRRWEADHSAVPSLARIEDQLSTTLAGVANVLIVDQSSKSLLPSSHDCKPKVTRRTSGSHSKTPPAKGVLMVLRCRILSHKVEISFDFDERAISSDGVGMLLAQYLHAIEQVSSPDSKAALRDLEALSKREESLLRQWTHEDLPTSKQHVTLVHDQIRQHAKTQPRAPAVSSWDCDLSHEELGDLSDRFAVYLARQGVEPRAVVPYFMDKSAVAVVVLLGILKAGAALLPLDSNHPAERLRGIIEESGASSVLVVSALHDKVKSKLASDSNNLKMLEVNMDMIRTLKLGSPADAAVTVNSSDLSYIIYTSGSTGKPKGVMVTHGNLSASATARLPVIGMTRHTRTLQYLNFIFDVAMFDVLLTLMVGGCVCLPSESEWSSDMAGAIRRTRANFVFLTPSLATLLEPSEVPTLDTLGLTGEACEAHIVEKWKQLRVLNMYGPAEATVHSSGADVSFGSGHHHLNIGRATGGGAYWAVDPSDTDRLVPIGGSGELLIYGPIVANGYMGDPDRTATVFIRSPVWAESMGVSPHAPHRWYKTGDLVVQLPDGSMVYQGRKDTQVKLSGQRIELGEIEHHLLRSSSNSSWHVAVELIKPDGLDQDNALVVFLAAVAQTNGRTDVEGSIVDSHERQQQGLVLLSPLQSELIAFRETLTASVPPYMIPRFYVHLRRLPMTSSGKLDRAALRRLGSGMTPAELGRYSVSTPGPSPSAQSLSVSETVNHDSSSSASQKQQELQIQLARLWSEVLGVPWNTIGTEDNFFSLGGSSIRATRLAHGARRIGIELKVTVVFERPTLREMASAVSWSRGSHTREVVKNDSDAELAAARAARLTKQLLADDEFRQSWDEHVTQRFSKQTRLTATEIESVASATDVQADMVAVGELDGKAWHNSMTVDSAAGLDVARLRRACAAVVSRHALLRTTFVQHCDRLYQVVLRPKTRAEGGELARFHLREVSGSGQSCHRLVLECHHAHYDAMAMDMVLADLREAYGKGDAWQPSPGVPRFDALAAHTESLDPAPARGFWTAALEGSTMTRLISAPPPAPPATPHPCVDTARLRVPMACVEVGAGFGTPSTVVQSAWALLLARATGTDDVVFCAPHANRDIPGFPDADRVAGLCLNFLPARARFQPGTTTLGALIRQMQTDAVAAIPHRHLGFRTVVRDCTSWPAWSRYGSMLIYQNHESLRRAIRFGDEDCVLTPYGNFGRCADLLVEATPTTSVDAARGEHKDELVVDLLFSRRSFTDAQVNWIVQTLEAILRAVPTSLDMPVGQVGRLLDSKLDPRPYPVSEGDASAPDMVPPEPMQATTVIDSHVGSRVDTRANGHLDGHLDGHARGQDYAHSLVRQAWSATGLLAARTDETTSAGSSEDQDCSMYDIMKCPRGGGGDLITTLLLARQYQRLGHNITMQQLIDSPTMRGQASIVANQAQNV